MTSVSSIYLSASDPRVPLRSEIDLMSARENGLIAENHFVELKREIKSGRSENRETARDLASLAVDGGTLIVGLTEVDGEIQLAPQPLSGLPERLDQIAAMIPDPPLAIITTPIPTAADPSLGYLLVHVPPSPAAPHMVDGKYLGRGDTTKRYLADAEVLRLHQQRATNEMSGMALLDVEFARDLFDDENRTHAHLFLIAEPLVARPDMLLSITDGNGWQQRVLDFRQRGRTAELRAVLGAVGAADFSPGLEEMQTFDRRPSGVAVSTYGIAPGRVRQNEEGYNDRESAAELEVGDDGSLRIYTSRLGDILDDGSHVVFESMAVGFTRQLIALTAAASEIGGYLGSWVLGVGATGMRGKYSYRQSQGWGGHQGAPYGEDTYKRVVVASYADLLAKPGRLTANLVGPMLRAYRTRDAFEPALADSPPPDVPE